MNQAPKAYTDALTGVSYRRYIYDNAQKFITTGADYQYWVARQMKMAAVRL